MEGYKADLGTFIILGLPFILIMIVKIIVNSVLRTKAVYCPDNLLKRNKPFYITKAGWDGIMRKACMHKTAQDSFRDFIEFIKPYYFTDRKIDC